MKKDAEFLKEQKAVYLKQNGYPANYLELQYVCPDCKDTGYADGKKCHCFKHMEIEILYDQSNIREVLERENFDTLSIGILRQGSCGRKDRDDRLRLYVQGDQGM